MNGGLKINFQTFLLYIIFHILAHYGLIWRTQIFYWIISRGTLLEYIVLLLYRYKYAPLVARIPLKAFSQSLQKREPVDE